MFPGLFRALLAGLVVSTPLAAQIVFGPPVSTPVASISIESAVADLNGDGHLDVILDEGEPLALVSRLGDGTGHFGAPINITDPSDLFPLTAAMIDPSGDLVPDMILGSSLSVVDLDGDGIPELIETVPFNDLVVHAGLGDGSFVFSAAIPIAGPEGIAASLAAGDADGDGDLDLLTAQVEWFGSTELDVLVNNGGALTIQPVAVPAGIKPFGALLADVNADGRLDAIVNSLGFFGGRTVEYDAAVLLGQPTGGFAFAGKLEDRPVADAGDVDGDGHVDLLAWHPDGAIVFDGLGNGSFVPGAVTALPVNAGPHALADFDGDGAPDLVAHDIGGVSVLRRGTGGGNFAASGTSYTWGGAEDVAYPDLGDVDADGRADLVAGVFVAQGAAVATALNVTYAPSSPLKDLGSALAGSQGFPIQVVNGTFTAGQPIAFELWGAPPSGAVFDVVGLSLLAAPFKGGVMLPHPDQIIGPLLADGAGTLSMPGVWPAGVPSGQVAWLQFWIVDAGGPAGLAASSGVQLTVP